MISKNIFYYNYPISDLDHCLLCISLLSPLHFTATLFVANKTHSKPIIVSLLLNSLIYHRHSMIR